MIIFHSITRKVEKTGPSSKVGSESFPFTYIDIVEEKDGKQKTN